MQTFLAAQGRAAKDDARRALSLSGKRKLRFRFSALWQILDGFVQSFLKHSTKQRRAIEYFRRLIYSVKAAYKHDKKLFQNTGWVF